MSNHHTIIKWSYNLATLGRPGCIVLISLAGCKEKYEFPSTMVNKNYPELEGSINRRADITTIPLPRTVQSADTACILPEQKAQVKKTGTAGENFHATGEPFGGFRLIPMRDTAGPDARVISYLGSTRHCMDCRTRGIHERPDFWLVLKNRNKR